MKFISHAGMPSQLSPNARWFACGDNAVLLRRGHTGLEQLPTWAQLSEAGLEPEEAQLVGTLDGEHCMTISWGRREIPAAFEMVGLRSLWARFEPELFAIAGRANHIAHFAQTHRFCGGCGTRTERAPDERAFRCPSCSQVSYPRISPAIITLVRRGDEALLASNAKFGGAFFSTLAGFADIGESLEEALAREVFEEVGINVGNVRYFGSQPWPFPNSLMVGFTAEYESGEIVVDGKEISEARFFRVDTLPKIPPKLSIARSLIDAWVRDVTGREAP